MSTDPTEALQRAIDSTTTVLSAVGADRLGHATPCAGWDVRALVNHIVGGMHFFHAAMTGQEASTSQAPDFSAGDFAADYETTAKQVVADFQADGALQRMVTMPFGTMPGAAVLGLATMDTFQHGWDLARATGQSTDLDADLAEQLLAQSRAMIPDAMRGPEDSPAPFGPVQEAPEGATAADRLAAFLGRTIEPA